MSEKKKPKGPFTATFTYTDEILSDFMAVYLLKKQVHPGTRIVCAAGGLAGIVYFGYMLYADGMSVARIGYLVTCSLLLLVAVAGGRDRNDGTTDKYRQYYAGRRVDFRIDEEGVWMKLSDQKGEARSAFHQIYSLCETDKCFYFIIKGKAYYIISKEAVSGGTPEELASYMQMHCQKKFLHYKV